MSAWRRLAMLGAGLALAGCDAGFGTQVELTYASAHVGTPDAATDAAVIAALRGYAQAHGLQCDPGTALPLHCATPPANILAVRSDGGATVCYGAMGITLESSKFQRRIDELTQTLARVPGARASATPMDHTMSPRCEQAWRAFDDARR